MAPGRASKYREAISASVSRRLLMASAPEWFSSGSGEDAVHRSAAMKADYQYNTRIVHFVFSPGLYGPKLKRAVAGFVTTL